MALHINYALARFTSAPSDVDSSSFAGAQPAPPAKDNNLADRLLIPDRDSKRLWTVELSRAPSNDQIGLLEAGQTWTGKITAIAYAAAVSMALLGWCYLLARGFFAGLDWIAD